MVCLRQLQFCSVATQLRYSACEQQYCSCEELLLSVGCVRGVSFFD
jgi:hypothetical protein